MACTASFRSRRPRVSSSILAVPVPLLLIALLAVLARPSSCRPLPLVPGGNSGGGGATAATSVVVILLPLLPTDDKAAAAAAAAGGSTTTAPSMPTTTTTTTAAEGQQDHQLAAGDSGSSFAAHQWLLDRKPRGKAPPSAPSKRTN